MVVGKGGEEGGWWLHMEELHARRPRSHNQTSLVGQRMGLIPSPGLQRCACSVHVSAGLPQPKWCLCHGLETGGVPKPETLTTHLQQRRSGRRTDTTKYVSCSSFTLQGGA